MNFYQLIKVKSINDNYSEISQLINDNVRKNIKIEEKKIYNKSFKLFLIIIYIIIISLFNHIILSKYYKFELRKDIINIEKYYKINDNRIILNQKTNIKKYIRPNISIISTIYNKEKYIIRFLRSIQNQNFNNIEIILIDDFSQDNSSSILDNIQKEDQRILLIKHNQNKGTLISRNEGIFLSKGKYIIIPDIDDIISNDILNQCIVKSIENHSDMIFYHTYLGYQKILIDSQIKNIINKTIYQPELSSFIFYGSSNIGIIDPIIRNKFINRKILIKSLNLLNDYFLNQNMIFYEDTLINFILYKTSKSIYFLNKIGYYYISNPNSSTKGFINNDILTNKILKSFFIFLKFIFFYTKNTKYEKNMANKILKKELNMILKNERCQKINDNFFFYYNIINIYLKSEFINLSLKKKLKDIKNIIINNQNKIKTI